MIDIHTHILPGLDDGAEHMEDALDMARAAWAEGITDVIATPHHANGAYQNRGVHVVEAVRSFRERLRLEGIPIALHAGQEIRVHDDLLDAWGRQELLTLSSSKYVLIEMPTREVPKSMPSLIHELSVMGLRMVIAHPERNLSVIGNPNLLSELIDLGAYAQVTTHSLLGVFGDRVKKCSWTLCRRGLIHLVSSDAHHVSRRGFRLKEAYERIESEVGREWVEYYMQNASSLLENIDFVQSPEMPREPKFFIKLTKLFRR
jgi:protein-tyrosine phosphatase